MLERGLGEGRAQGDSLEVARLLAMSQVETAFGAHYTMIIIRNHQNSTGNH